jgi:hypothetical protein
MHALFVLCMLTQLPAPKQLLQQQPGESHSPRGLILLLQGTAPMLYLIERTVPKDAVHAADMVYAQAYMPTKAAPGYAPYTNAWARKDEVMLEVLHKAQVKPHTICIEPLLDLASPQCNARSSGMLRSHSANLHHPNTTQLA